MNRSINMALGWVLCLLSTCASAALLDRGNGTVYDTVQDITWLQNWHVNGQKTWVEQMAWADDLSYAGGSDWSLPTIQQYLALLTQGGSLKTVGAPFVNSASEKYFSSSEVSPGSINVWLFANNGGFQTKFLKGQRFFATAIHPGDLASPVPEPGSLQLGLFGMVAGAVAWRGRRAIRG